MHNEKRYSVAVVATMSAGKSSLLNALMETDLLPSQNEACTATVFQIEDHDEQSYFTGRYKRNGKWSEWSSGRVDKETLQQWNHEAPQEIELQGDLPNIDNTPAGLRVCFIDTPGPNNSMCDAHEKITQSVLEKNDFSTLIFVINSSVAGVKDESNFLFQIKKLLAGHNSNTQIIFALNKIDLLDIEKGESVLNTVKTISDYLEKQIGFSKPIVIPVCSILSSGIRQAIHSAKRLTQSQLAKLTGAKIPKEKYRTTKGNKRKLKMSRTSICRLPQRTQMELADLLDLFKTYADEYISALDSCEALKGIDSCRELREDYENLKNKISSSFRKLYIYDHSFTYRELHLLDTLTGIPYLEKFIETQIFSIPSSEEEMTAEEDDNTSPQVDEVDDDDVVDSSDSISDEELAAKVTPKKELVLTAEVIAQLPQSQADFNTPGIYTKVELNASVNSDVKLACSANKWHTVPMYDLDDHGIYTANLYLPAGRHFCKFIVNGEWTYNANLSWVPDSLPDYGTYTNILYIETKSRNENMLQVNIKYNPYLVTTELTLNDTPVADDSKLGLLIKEARLQDWIDKFFGLLYEETREKNLQINFTGTEWDADDLMSAVDDYLHVHSDFEISITRNISKLNDEQRLSKLKEVFEEGKQSPFAELFNSPKMEAAFARATDPDFEVNVIATMSSGKSTVVNSLLGQELMPAKNEACTATIARIRDNDNQPEFYAQRFDKDDKPLSEVELANQALLTEWNDDPQTHLIELEGDIPTVNQTSSCTYVIIDTPGPNNARNAEHEKATMEAIQSKPLSMVLYILNSTQLSTRDDDQLLKLVCKEMNKGGRKAHDRFIFIANKIDAFDPERGESVTRAMENVRIYLREHGINNPIVIPASAQLAKMLRLPEDKLSRRDRGELRTLIELFTEEPEMNMLEHSKARISAHCARLLEARLREAKAIRDQEESKRKVAEILSGIPIIEALLNDFLQKHALPAKLKDAVDTFNQVMQESDIAKNMNDQLTKSSEELRAASEAFRKFTEDQKNLQKADDFRKKVKNLNYALSKNAEDAVAELKDEAEKLIENIGLNIQDNPKVEPKEARHIIEYALQQCKSLEARVQTTLNQALENEYMSVIGKLRNEYEEYVASVLNESFPEGSSLRKLQAVSMSLPTTTEMVMEYSQTQKVKVGEKTQKVTKKVPEIQTGYRNGEEKKRWDPHAHWKGTKRCGFLWLKKVDVWEGDYVGTGEFEQIPYTYTVEVEKQIDETVDIYEDKQFIDLYSLYRNLGKTIRNYSQENYKHFSEEAKENVNYAKNMLLHQMDVIDTRVREIGEQLKVANMDKEKKEQMVRENQQKVEWFDQFRAKIEKILAI